VTRVFTSTHAADDDQIHQRASYQHAEANAECGEDQPVNPELRISANNKKYGKGRNPDRD